MSTEDWRPIDTAPKDGTWILGMNNRGNPAVIIWSDAVEGWIHPFGFGEASPFWNGASGSAAEFWMPIRPHPKSPEKPYWAGPAKAVQQRREPELALDQRPYVKGLRSRADRAAADDDVARAAIRQLRDTVTGDWLAVASHLPFEIEMDLRAPEGSDRQYRWRPLPVTGTPLPTWTYGQDYPGA